MPTTEGFPDGWLKNKKSKLSVNSNFTGWARSRGTRICHFFGIDMTVWYDTKCKQTSTDGISLFQMLANNELFIRNGETKNLSKAKNCKSIAGPALTHKK